MGNFPTSPRSAVLSFSQAHQLVWQDAGPNIGVSTAMNNEFKNAVNDYATLQQQADAAKFALETLNRQTATAYSAMRSKLGSMVRTITAYAEDQGDPAAVFARAQIPGPQPAGIAPPPAQPTNLNASIIASSGKIQLTWKAANPRGTSGTSYIIFRKLPSQTAFSFLGVSGEKRFVDGTFLAGPDSVQYKVQGQRADSPGPESEVFTLNFGLPGPGEVNASSFVEPKSATPKLAA